MPEDSPSAALDKILDDITKMQQLLDTSVGLVKSLHSTCSNSIEDQSDSIEKAKDVINELDNNVSSIRSRFYRCCDTWRNKLGCTDKSKSKKQLLEGDTMYATSESECLGNRDKEEHEVILENGDKSAIDSDAMSKVQDMINTNDCENAQCSSKCEMSIANGNKNVDMSKDIEGAENIVKPMDEGAKETMIHNSEETSRHNLDISEGVAENITSSQKNTDNIKTGKEVENKNKEDVFNRDSNTEEVQKPVIGQTNIINRKSTTDKHKEKADFRKEMSCAINNSMNMEQNKSDMHRPTDIINIDHVVVDEINEKICNESINSTSKCDAGSNDSDPLNMDSLSNDNDSNTFSSANSSKNTDVNAVVKEESAFKIKCVDINKLLESAPALPVITDSKTKALNSSVVVISDSESEASPRKCKETNGLDGSLGSEITVTRLVPQKKIIILDDSDSSEANSSALRKRNKVDSLKKSAKESRRARAAQKDKQPLRSAPCDKNVDKNRRQLRKRPVKNNLKEVSSSSESSSSSASEDDMDNIGKNIRKTKRKQRHMSGNHDTQRDISLLTSISDKKFSCKCYVPLVRTPAEQLKKNYEKYVLNCEIKNLTNIESLKRSRKEKEDSSNSAESDTSKTKGHCSKRSKQQRKELNAHSDSDNSDISMCSSKLIEKEQAETLKTSSNNVPTENGETEISEALLNNIGSDNNADLGCEDNDSGEEDDGKTKTSMDEQQLEDVVEKTPTPKKKRKDTDGGSEDEASKEKKNWRRDKLLTENITESDSDEDFAKFIKKRGELEEKNSDIEEVPKVSTRRLKKKCGKYVLGSSDSDASISEKHDSSASAKSGSDSNSSDGQDKEKKKSRRRRIKRLKDSSAEEENAGDKSTRKQIRKVWARDSLSATTIAAEKEEQERKARIAERQKKYNAIFEAGSLEKSSVDKLVLDFDEKTEKEILKVDKRLVKHLKPHQAVGIQFMWNTCFESLDRAKDTKGSGCILAHCMGLGKTLQVIALIHTLIANQEKTGVRKVLVVCPLSTVLNWVAEFKKWLPDDDEVEVYELVSFKQNNERMYQVKEWDRTGGALVLGYDMFRNLTNTTNKRLSKKIRNVFQTCLVDPGAELVICDEGHLLKNEKTSISVAMNRLKTLRRIVLTGTPLQNNMKEYFCMVQFVKPNLLGTFKEYLNRFVNPITNGQYTDSTPHDINIMRKRSHVLHKLLDGVVQRKDYSVLAPFLPPKYEFVLFVSLTEKQIKLYERYFAEKSGRNGDGGGSKLFVDFNEFQRICTHPRVLLDKSIELKQARDKQDFLDDESEGSLKDFIDDDTDKSSTSASSSGNNDSDSGSNDSQKKEKKKVSSRKQRVTRATAGIYTISDKEESGAEGEQEPDPLEWWREYCTDEDLDNIHHSGKLSLLFEILKQCELIGDKILIFSQSLYSLNVIEYFLSKIDEATQNGGEGFCGFSGSWSPGLDYFRLDGSSSCEYRAAWCKTFNDPENVRARLFLISTRAGGLGINLVAANRVIIFDVSWNPSHDTQSIYRVYRFGQTKPCYIYRFVTLGTMEMKVYERQVTKQAISKRVIDEQQIDRHYNQNDLAELYKFEPVPEEDRPIPLVPKDVLLGELLQADGKIYKYHEHHSLLENKEDEVLDEEERKAAWEEFENEKKARAYSGTIAGYSAQALLIALQSITRKANPSWDHNMVSDKTRELFEKLDEEVQAGNSPLLQEAVTEIRLMQVAQQQQANISQYYRMMQQQQALMNQFRMRMMTNQGNPRLNYPQPMNNMRMPGGGNYPRQRAPDASAFARAMPETTIDYVDLND